MLMGWMYDSPFEQLRREDALSFLTWMKHGLPLEAGLLTEEQIKKLIKNDLVLLEEKVNGGNPLPSRKPGEDPLPILRFNCEPLRFRHKPILFYVAIEASYYNLRRSKCIIILIFWYLPFLCSPDLKHLFSFQLITSNFD